ncbi:hypothetical protein PSTT_03076 [Puccinia striiformis]|uniref:Double-strand break repair protein n=1 Tax=Puccinia striiformis TaxID=27350 RepID=A0A2S4VXX2_9BASI|nr:hypothetical protein PSTT_03076 [Puccinia striiformis]
MSDEEEQPLDGTPNLTNQSNLCLPTPSIANKDNENSIKILVATDNHIGYAESDPIRGQDSINTFREILQLAVDMLLLAGDLFHENRPSRASLYSTIASLREYCLNDRPVHIELIGDSGIGIPHSFNFPSVNYEDQNINVGLPVFSIHGNHDDPQGMGPEGALCALDVLSASGLINYFGRQELPGGAQNDEEAREEGLHINPYFYRREGLDWLCMVSATFETKDSIMKCVVIGFVCLDRLNSRNNGLTSCWYIKIEDGFGDDIDLVIWGHEHDCLIQPVEVPGKGYFITQPGSSYLSFCWQHVGILEVQDRDFSFVPIPLKTVRPFIFEDIVLAEDEEEKKLKLDDKPKIVKYLKSLVEELIKRAETEWDDEHQDDPDPPSMMLPLIRLRVEYTRPDGQTAYDVGNPQRFGQEFLGKVANPKDLVQFHRRRKIGLRKPKNDIDEPEQETLEGSQGKLSEKVQVATLVHQYLEAQNLGVLAENGMQRAVTLFVEKDDKDAIKEFYHNALEATQAHVQGSKADLGGGSSSNRQDRNPESEDEELLEELTKAKESYADEWEKNQKNELGGTNKGKGKAARKVKRNDDDSDESDFGKMSDVQYVGGSDDDDLGQQSDSDTNMRAPVAPSKKKAPAKSTTATKKAPAKEATPATKAAPKRATKSTTTTTTGRGKATASGSQTTLNFSQQKAPLRGASKRTAAGASSNTQQSVLVEEDSDDSIEVTTQRKTASRSRR